MFKFTSRKRNRNRPAYTPRREKASRITRNPRAGKGPGARAAAWLGKVDWGRLRINVVVCIFCLLWVGLWGRAWYLQMVEGPRLADRARRQHMASELVSGRRGMIYDRNGQVLARSVEARSVYAKPQDVEDFLVMANTLGPILGIAPQKLYDELSKSKRRFVWLRRKVDDYTAEAVRKANLPGIGLSKEYDRVYPFKHMAGQLLGFVGLDDKGLEGIERSLEARLGCIPTRQIVQRDAMGRRFYLHEEGQTEPRGQDVTLTIDVQMQFIAEEAVARAARDYDARWSGALVVDVPTGDILAWAQYPFFNPNTYRESSPLIYRNRLAADALEPGSTFKPFVMAAALQERKITPNTLIDCERGKWVSKTFTIRDTSIQGILPASKVLRYSSNIGMAKIGLALGAPVFHRYLHSLGFGERTSVPVAESRGILRIPRDWSEVDLMSTAFGQSISVTGLQMAQGYLTLLNHGVYKPLRLIREESHVEERHKRIFSEKTTREVMDMMRDVVEERDGTGRRARIAGVEVAGKTGTAQKADHRAGTYGNKHLASFVGFLPADEPRYLIFVMVDEPSRNQFGGVVAAPVFKEIAGRALTYTGILSETMVTRAAGGPNAGQAAGRQRGLKLAGLDVPYLAKTADAPRRAPAMQLPGHLARASSRVPDVMGKSVRNAVELFARAGVVPELKGSGTRVVRQSPPAGTAWPEDGTSVHYILWLSER
ncbi:penicillin-binding protein [uncultured Desulfovibrio sp.]|uniref:penicillin-binding protein n=1 Tax=uncultured Desulfovibrio sp. TaxID=167968 RepID=UPI0026114434|nr:penicillin-binding protein [uncultured Desulfovibrio sp.]